MVDYGFYTQEYLGCTIPEKAFPRLALRAQEELTRLEQVCRVENDGQTARSMALCAMAECLYEQENRRGLQAHSVGSVSVRYDRAVGRKRALFECAATYLDLRRGVV